MVFRFFLSNFTMESTFIECLSIFKTVKIYGILLSTRDISFDLSKMNRFSFFLCSSHFNHTPSVMVHHTAFWFGKSIAPYRLVEIQFKWKNVQMIVRLDEWSRKLYMHCCQRTTTTKNYERILSPKRWINEMKKVLKREKNVTKDATIV